MRERELKLLPIGLSEQRQLELVNEFKAKDFRHKDEYILSYVRLSRWIAVKEFFRVKCKASLDDMQGVAYLALLSVPTEISNGRLESKSLYKYTIARVRTNCREYVRKDFLVATPERSARRGKQILHRKIEIKVNDEDAGIYPYTDPVLASMYAIEDKGYERHKKRKELINELLRHTKNALEHTVISLHISSYTDREIAWKLGTSEATVRNARNAFVQRLKDKIKQDADFLALS